MSTSAQQINDLINSNQALTAAYDAKKEAIDDAVSDAIAAIPNNFKVFYIDQVTGNDANPGTLAEPLASIDRALALTPVGGICDARLTSDYTHTTRIELNRQTLRLWGYQAVREFRPQWVVIDSEVEYMAQFLPKLGSEVEMLNLDVYLPPDPAQTFRYTHMRGFISGASSEMQSVLKSRFRDCAFYLNGSTVGSFFGAPEAYVFARFQGTTSFSGDFAGRLVQGVGGTGVDPADVLDVINTDSTFV